MSMPVLRDRSFWLIVTGFVVGRFFKGADGVFVTHFAGQLGTVALLDMGHGFAGKGRFKGWPWF